MFKNSLYILLFLSSSLFAAKLYNNEQQLGTFTAQNSYFVSLQDLPKMEAEEHFNAGMKAYEEKAYHEAAKHFRIVKLNFFNTPHALDANYYLGVCYYNMNDIDLANEELSEYLKSLNTPKYFQQALELKFTIAERLKSGERRHIFGVQSLPKWFTGKWMAVEAYDDVIASLPSHEYAAQSLYAKGVLLKDMKEFRESVDSFQMLIKRFPRHELAPEAYLAIGKVYLEQCQYEFQNPDLITFSEINLRKFAADFPREGRIEELKKGVAEMKEVYAQGLYDTGKFYERLDKLHASVLCYKNAQEKFPETKVAKKCQERAKYLEEKMWRLAHDTRTPYQKNQGIKPFVPNKTA